MRRYLPYIAIVASMIVWSVSGIAIKYALAVLPPFTMIVLRFLPAVLLMFIVGMLCRKSRLFALQRLDIKDAYLFVCAGFCQPFLYYLLETFSFQALDSPTIAEALLSTGPLVSPVLAVLFLRERITRNNILGILISTLGVLMLILLGSENFSIGNYWGIPLAFFAVTAAVMDTVIIRGMPSKYTPLTIIFYGQLVSLLLFIPVWFWREGPSALATIFVDPAYSSSAVTTALLSVAYLTVFASVVAFILFCYALRRIGVTQANAFNNVRPAFTALWMLVFFGEHLPFGKWIGILLIIIGLFVCQKTGGLLYKKK